MKVLILAGGLGSRFGEVTAKKPKPMIEIGGKPILWHIMKMYSQYGFNEFIVLCGYKGYMIKEYFANYFLYQSDITIDLQKNSMEILNNSSEPWRVTLIDTGLHAMTGARIKKAQKIVGNDPFLLTYGDGVGDINIEELIQFHKDHGKFLTMTSAQPDGRFGALDIGDDNRVLDFKEKPKGDGSWINAGFFVCQPEVFDYIPDNNSIMFEKEPLEHLARDRELITFKHRGFWKPMDSLKDKKDLNTLWDNNLAPWKIWS